MIVTEVEFVEVEIVCIDPMCGYYWYVTEDEVDVDCPEFICPHCGGDRAEVAE